MNESELLYKYVPINKDTKTMINPNTFKFNFPSALNDIFDCKVYPDINKISDSIILEFVGPHIKTPNLSDSEIIKIIRSLPQDDLIVQWEKTLDRVCIICFSRVKESKLMWGHYADCYRGMCIGYNKKS